MTSILTANQLSLDMPQTEWQPPHYNGRKMVCGRDPKAGPGTCRLWWEGCPKQESTGCYLHWLSQQPPTKEKTNGHEA